MVYHIWRGLYIKIYCKKDIRFYLLLIPSIFSKVNKNNYNWRSFVMYTVLFYVILNEHFTGVFKFLIGQFRKNSSLTYKTFQQNVCECFLLITMVLIDKTKSTKIWQEKVCVFQIGTSNHDNGQNPYKFIIFKVENLFFNKTCFCRVKEFISNNKMPFNGYKTVFLYDCNFI